MPEKNVVIWHAVPNGAIMPETRYIFVTGGVTSSLGKGIISASLAKLLKPGDILLPFKS